MRKTKYVVNSMDDKHYRFKVYEEAGVVIAITSFHGKQVVGKAICSPNDKFDLEVGKAIAKAKASVKVKEKRAKYYADEYSVWNSILENAKVHLNYLESKKAAAYEEEAMAYRQLIEIMDSVTV